MVISASSRLPATARAGHQNSDEAGYRFISLDAHLRDAPLTEVNTNARASVLRDLRWYPTVEAIDWHAMYAPAGTSPRLIDKMSTAIVAAFGARNLPARLTALALEPTGSTSEQLATIMAADIVRRAPIIKATGFSAE